MKDHTVSSGVFIIDEYEGCPKKNLDKRHVGVQGFCYFEWVTIHILYN